MEQTFARTDMGIASSRYASLDILEWFNTAVTEAVILVKADRGQKSCTYHNLSRRARVLGACDVRRLHRQYDSVHQVLGSLDEGGGTVELWKQHNNVTLCPMIL